MVSAEVTYAAQYRPASKSSTPLIQTIYRLPTITFKLPGVAGCRPEFFLDWSPRMERRIVGSGLGYLFMGP